MGAMKLQYLLPCGNKTGAEHASLIVPGALDLDRQQQCHAGDDYAILTARHALYSRSRELNPARWSGNTRYWVPIGAVTLNFERDCIVKSHLAGHNIQPLAA